MSVHTFTFKADYWTWCSSLPGKRTRGLYWKIPFWENFITDTANSSRLIFQFFSQSCSYGNPLISSIFLIRFCFYRQSTLLIIFSLLFCKISWCSVLCRPFRVYETVNPTDCQKKEAIMLPKWFWPTYMQLDGKWQWGKWEGSLEMFMSSNPLWCYQKPSERASARNIPGTLPLSFRNLLK